MERHSLRALLSIGVLVILAWVGIALVAKLHGHTSLVVSLVIWGVVVLGVAAVAVWSLVEGRRARLERRVEGTRDRK